MQINNTKKNILTSLFVISAGAATPLVAAHYNHPLISASSGLAVGTWLAIKEHQKKTERYNTLYQNFDNHTNELQKLSQRLDRILE